MPRKPMTPEERKAFGEKMKAAREAKAVTKDQVPAPAPAVVEEPTSEPRDPGSIQNVDIAELQRQIMELQARAFMTNLPAQAYQDPNAPQVNQQGKLIGTHTKFSVDPANYPDPCERIAKEPRLARFAFDLNYELTFSVGVSEYPTIEGTRVREPKFELELVRILMDEDTGLPTNRRYVICRAVFHEDPEAAIIIAREQGLPVDETNEKAFLDEMRYIRMRDWVIEAFYPPPVKQKQNKREMVINGKLVEYFEINSEDTETIPFNSLKNKIKA